MTDAERDIVIRETVELCAAAVRGVRPVLHSKGVNGIATIDRAAEAVASLAVPRINVPSAPAHGFADLQRRGLPRPAKP